MYNRVLHPTVATGVERPWSEDEIIVSKTDKRGIITYANNVFQRLAQMDEDELVGKPHNIIRHPEMPRCVFKLLWDTLEQKKEIFAFVNNMARSGDNYWVFAHVTPSLDEQGAIVGYHSNRRKPPAEKIEKIKPVYALLLAEELKHTSPKAGMEASTNLLLSILQEKNTTYDRFIFSI